MKYYGPKQSKQFKAEFIMYWGDLNPDHLLFRWMRRSTMLRRQGVY
jgi:hypothetical protein